MTLRALSEIRIFLNKILFNLNVFVTGERAKSISYSQSGEDLIVQYIFNALKINHPSYLDIGAYHPYKFSNTALFYAQGSSGVNIEPNINLHKNFKKKRKRDLNLNVGVTGNRNEKINFYVLSSATLSTFSKSEAEHSCSIGYTVIRIDTVQVMPICEIINKYCNNKFPDFLSLDVEGLDFEILQHLDYSRDSPKVICVETLTFSEIGSGIKNLALIDFLEKKGYMVYADTNINTIFVQESIWVREKDD